MATPQRIATELARMAMLYRHPLDVENELRHMVAAWDELCSNITDEDFAAACRLHLSRSRYFPCPADIIAASGECRPVRNTLPALPPYPEHKTCGLGVLMVAAFRGDPAARAKVEQFRQQPRKTA